MSSKTNARLNNTMALTTLEVKEILTNDVFVQSVFESPIGSLSGVDSATDNFRLRLNSNTGSISNPWGKTHQWNIEPGTGHFLNKIQLELDTKAFSPVNTCFVNDISSVIQRVTIQQGSFVYELESDIIGVHHQVISDFDEIDRTADRWGIGTASQRDTWASYPHKYIIDIPTFCDSYPFALCLLSSPIVVRITFRTLNEVICDSTTPPTVELNDLRLVVHMINTSSDVISRLQATMNTGRLLYVYEDHQKQTRNKVLSNGTDNFDVSGLIGLMNRFIFTVRKTEDISSTTNRSYTRLVQPQNRNAPTTPVTDELPDGITEFQLTSNNVPIYGGSDFVEAIASANEILPEAYDSYVNRYWLTVNDRNALLQTDTEAAKYLPSAIPYTGYTSGALYNQYDKDQYYGIFGLPLSISGELANKKQLAYIDFSNSNPRLALRFSPRLATDCQIDLYGTSYNVLVVNRGQLSKLLA